VRVIVREKVRRGEREHCEFVLIISKGFPEFWGWLREVVRLKSRRLDWKQRLGRFLWRDKHTDSNLARNPGKGSCFCVLFTVVITLCLVWSYVYRISALFALFFAFSRFCLETAWRACMPARRFIHLCVILASVNLNRLVGMNIRQAARQCSWSLAIFVVVSVKSHCNSWNSNVLILLGVI